MDWKKAKTILLLVLLCTNLFMVCNLAGSKASSAKP